VVLRCDALVASIPIIYVQLSQNNSQTLTIVQTEIERTDSRSLFPFLALSIALSPIWLAK
jgi:hypothetical protein